MGEFVALYDIFLSPFRQFFAAVVSTARKSLDYVIPRTVGVEVYMVVGPALPAKLLIRAGCPKMLAYRE